MDSKRQNRQYKCSKCINVLFSASLNFSVIYFIYVSAQDAQSGSWKYGPRSFEFNQPAEVRAILYHLFAVFLDSTHIWVSLIHPVSFCQPIREIPAEKVIEWVTQSQELSSNKTLLIDTPHIYSLCCCLFLFLRNAGDYEISRGPTGVSR